MKIKLIFAILIPIIILFGCSKKSDSTTPAPTATTTTTTPPSVNGSCTATFDGTNWTANSITATESTDTMNHNEVSTLVIQATNTSTPYSVEIILTWSGGLNNGPTAATYSLLGLTQASITFWIGSLPCNYTVSGTLTVLSVDTTNKVISGTFNMQAYENSTNHYLTNGVFSNVHY